MPHNHTSDPHALVNTHGSLSDDLATMTLAQAYTRIDGDRPNTIPFLVWLLEESVNEYDILRYEIWEQYYTDKILYVNPLHDRSIAVLFQGDWEKVCELESVRDRVHQKLLDRRISSELIIDRLELDTALRESKKTYSDFYKDVIAHSETECKFQALLESR